MSVILKSGGISYRIITEEYVDEAAKITSQIFCKNEYLARELKITKDELYSFILESFKNAVKERNSTMAKKF